MTGFRRYLGSISVAVVGLALMVVFVATGPVAESEADTVQPPVVRLAEARPAPPRLTVAAHGVVVPKTESRLVSEISGRIVAVADSMVSGGFFERGDVLVSIDRVDYELALEQARARLSSAKSELARARREYARQERLTATDAGSESKRDEAANRQLAAAASLREATAHEKRAERDLERTRVIAPYDGRVRSELVDPGQFVNRGETLANLYSVDVAEVRLPVHDDDLAFLPVTLAGALDPATQPAVVLRARFAGREHEWRGRIVRTEGEIDPGTRMVKMIAQVERPYDQPDGKPPLTVGLFVDAEIEGREVGGAVVVPRAALQSEAPQSRPGAALSLCAGDASGPRPRRPRVEQTPSVADAPSGACSTRAQVHVIDADGRLAVRQVDVVRLLGEDAYVRGLHRDERVSLTRLPGAVDGLRVRTAGNGGTAEPAP